MVAMTPNPPGMPPRMPIPGVKNLIAVGSGKGGVGKTTVSVNLAVALASLGYKAGLMDADVYGPNVPLMMGINRTPMVHGERIQPLEQYGVRLMSMGFLNPGDKPLVWRGPMLHSVIQQFVRGVDWGELDYLIIDLPPGTGDVALSLIQSAPLTGAIVVTTPSDVSLEDARKAIHMFHQVKVPILGIGELPLDPKVRIGGDSGRPIALRPGEGESFLELARNTLGRVQEAAGQEGPTIEISE